MFYIHINITTISEWLGLSGIVIFLMDFFFEKQPMNAPGKSEIDEKSNVRSLEAPKEGRNKNVDNQSPSDGDSDAGGSDSDGSSDSGDSASTWTTGEPVSPRSFDGNLNFDRTGRNDPQNEIPLDTYLFCETYSVPRHASDPEARKIYDAQQEELKQAYHYNVNRSNTLLGQDRRDAGYDGSREEVEENSYKNYVQGLEDLKKA